MRKFAIQFDEETLQILETLLKNGETRQALGISALSEEQQLQIR
jgi:hypothetical protein